MGFIAVHDSFPKVDELVVLTNIVDNWVVFGHVDKDGDFYNEHDSFPEDCIIRPSHWINIPTK